MPRRRHLLNTQNYTCGERVLLLCTHLFIILSGGIYILLEFCCGHRLSELLANVLHRFEKYLFLFFLPQIVFVTSRFYVARTAVHSKSFFTRNY